MGSQQKYKIFDLESGEFEEQALEIFRHQYHNNDVYQNFSNALGVNVSAVKDISQIPFLPIRFFKLEDVKTGSFAPEQIFESSGTTGMVNSRHLVKDLSLYTESFSRGFRNVYGDPKNYCILGLLPSYLERKNSSLVYMVDRLIKDSGHPDSGFYLDDLERLHKKLSALENSGQPTILIGVSFALLDFAEKFPMELKNTIIMETGGMKGRRKELVRDELHEILKRAFHLNVIHSEYGMTELLSQAYSVNDGKYVSPPWMKILLRDESDPLTVIPPQPRTITGAINVIDLANIHSCSFIATDDAARLFPDGSFEVLGRLDGSDLRGCSLLVS